MTMTNKITNFAFPLNALSYIPFYILFYVIFVIKKNIEHNPVISKNPDLMTSLIVMMTKDSVIEHSRKPILFAFGGMEAAEIMPTRVFMK